MILSPSCAVGHNISLDGKALGKDQYSGGDGTSDAALGLCCHVISAYCVSCRHHQAEPSRPSWPSPLLHRSAEKQPVRHSFGRKNAAVAWALPAESGEVTTTQEAMTRPGHTHFFLSKKTHRTIQHNNQGQSVGGNVVTTQTLT